MKNYIERKAKFLKEALADTLEHPSRTNIINLLLAGKMVFAQGADLPMNMIEAIVEEELRTWNLDRKAEAEDKDR